MDYYGVPAQGTPARAAYDEELREAVRDFARYDDMYLDDDRYYHTHDHSMPAPFDGLEDPVPAQPPPPYTPHPHAAAPTTTRRRAPTAHPPPPATPRQMARPRPTPAASAPAPVLSAHDLEVQGVREMLLSTLKGSLYLSAAYLTSHALTHTLHNPFRLLRAALVKTEAASLTSLHYFRRVSIPIAALLGTGIAISSGALVWELWIGDFLHDSPARQLAFLDAPSALLVQCLPTRVQTPVYFLVGLSAAKRLDRAVFGNRGVFSGVVWRALTAPWRALRDALEDCSDDDSLRRRGWGELEIELERTTRQACRQAQRMLDWGLVDRPQERLRFVQEHEVGSGRQQSGAWRRGRARGRGR